MDLCWRSVIEFLFHGCSNSVRAMIEPDSAALMIVDQGSVLGGNRLRSWHRLSEATCTSAAKLNQVARAIEQRDAITIRQCIRTVMHYTCLRARIVIQESGNPRAVHLVWYSRMFNQNHQGVSTFGPHASFPKGTSIVINVHHSVIPWLAHTFLYEPQVHRDPELWAQHSRDVHTATHALLTPQKGVTAHDDSLDRTWETPVAKDEALRCEVCYTMTPFSLCIILESCTHTLCLQCATACALSHCEASGATPRTMSCPAFGCDKRISATEMRLLVSADQFADLEFNEVRIALQDSCVVCPSCSFTFERIAAADLATDPLRDKLMCSACSATFCAKCGVTPFHVGKQCRDGGYSTTAPRCRYCGNIAVQVDPVVCDQEECQEKGQRCCLMSKQCGHACFGTQGERSCVTCLDPTCQMKHTVHSADDFCVICYTDALSDAPCLELDCGHVFHQRCLEQKLEKRWPTARINFRFLECPLCEKEIQHHLLAKLQTPIIRLRDALEGRYVERLRIEGLIECEALVNPNSPFYNKPIEYARLNLNFYECSKCNRAYFGGLRNCQNVDRDEPDRSELICGGCSSGSATCDKHGNQFMEWKCKYCCNTAVWYCWGTTHFCELCHSPPRKTVREECPGEETCPLRGKHLPSGVEFAIGCAMCRADAVNK